MAKILSTRSGVPRSDKVKPGSGEMRPIASPPDVAASGVLPASLDTPRRARSLHIRAVSPPDREFELPGEIITAG